MSFKFKYCYRYMVVPTESPGKQIEISSKSKIAFVCSGGAIKAGAFHLGVALALQEQGFKFYGGTFPKTGEVRAPSPMEISTYVGSSAGAIISSYLAAGYTLDNIFNSFLGRKPTAGHADDFIPKVLPRLTYQKMFKVKPNLPTSQIVQFFKLKRSIFDALEGQWDSVFNFKWLKINGIFSTYGIEKYMREEVLLSNNFKEYMAELFIVATQLNHSRKVVFGKYSFQPPPHDLSCQYSNDVGISDACAASVALPVIFSPHPIKTGGQHPVYYIDGEIRDTLSTHVAVDAGADLVIASYTHQPYHFPDDGSLTNFGLPSIAIQSIYLLIEQKIKNHIYNKKIQRNAIDAVSRYCKSVDLTEEHRHQICQILEAQLHHRMEVDTIYIHPDPNDAQLFFGEHFSLSPKKMAEIVRSGFRSAIQTLRKYRFADRGKSPVIGKTAAV